MSLDQQDQTLVNTTDQSTASKLWRPIRPIVLMNPLDDQITKLQKKVQPPSSVLQPKPAGTPTVENLSIPEQLLMLSATESPSKQQDRTFSQVAVTFVRDSSDTSFDHVNIWIKGYKGNPSRVLATSGSESPIYFLLETTGETITITGQPVSSSGVAAAIELSRVCTVALDGVVSAPPAPTITQQLIGTVTGYQFTFQQLSALDADVIDCYKVYRNTVNNSGTATLLKTYKHDPTNANAPIVVQDAATGGTIYWYWVSAVDTMGLESVLEPAQTSATYTTGRAQSLVPSIIPLNLVATGSINTSYTQVNYVAMPGAFEVYGYVPTAGGSIIDVVLVSSLYASGGHNYPNGYIFRLDPRAGYPMGQLVNCTHGNFSAMGTQIIGNNSVALQPGWYKIRGEWGADGLLNVYINDIWCATAQDTTYSFAPGFTSTVVYVGAELSAAGAKVSSTGGSTGLNNQGSLATITGLTFSYTATPTSITISWASGIIYNLDGSTISVGSGSFAAFTGLTSSKTYYFAAYYDLSTSSMVIVISDVASGQSPFSLQAIAQVLNLDGHIPININFTAVTPASGSSGGGPGGGSGNCFSGNTRIRTKRGIVPFSEVKPGDYVLTAALTWRKVIGTTCRPYAGDMIDMGDGELVTPSHMMFYEGGWRKADECVQGPRAYHELDVWNMHVEAKQHDNEHSYALGNGLFAHNIILGT